MERILQCRFMRTLLRGQKHDYDPNYLLSSYQEFKSLLLSISDDEQNYREKFRTMQSLRKILESQMQSSRFQNERGENIKWFATQALNQISVELDLLDKQLQYPVLFTPATRSSKPQTSPLYWNTDKFSKRDLIELVAAMAEIGVILDDKREPLSFTKLIEHISTFFNLQISTKSAFNERDYIRNIRCNAVEFTKKLNEAFKKNVK